MPHLSHLANPLEQDNPYKCVLMKYLPNTSAFLQTIRVVQG